jgi:hypothetical protein
MSKGAKPSDSVRQLFQSAGLLDRFERFKKGEAVETLMAEAGTTPGSPVASQAKPAGKAKAKVSPKED